jgi:excisionase family DNA binding protein
MNDLDLLTMAEVAALLHISKGHVCNLVSGRVNGCSRLPALRLGRRMLVRREALARWLEENEHGMISAPKRVLAKAH